MKKLKVILISLVLVLTASCSYFVFSYFSYHKKISAEKEEIAKISETLILQDEKIGELNEEFEEIDDELQLLEQEYENWLRHDQQLDEILQ